MNIYRTGYGASQVVLVVKNTPANAEDIRDVGSIPESGRSPGEGHGHPLQYSRLENPMDREARWATVHRVTQSQTQLKRLSTKDGFKKTFAFCLSLSDFSTAAVHKSALTCSVPSAGNCRGKRCKIRFPV